MNKNIVLIGLPGCGKSTIGYKLANMLDVNFVDIDLYIEKKEKNTISGIFENGEVYFRQIEGKYVEEIAGLKSTVIATGGGVVKNEKNMLLLKNNAVIIYINRKIMDIQMDIDDSVRPLLKGKKDKLEKLYIERHELYQKYCDYEVVNNSSLYDCIEKIIKICTSEGLL